MVKTSEQKARSTRSAAAQANSVPNVDVAGRLENLFGKDDDSDATPENNVNAANSNPGDSSGDDVQKWAEVDGEETEDLRKGITVKCLFDRFQPYQGAWDTDIVYITCL